MPNKNNSKELEDIAEKINKMKNVKRMFFLEKEEIEKLKGHNKRFKK